MALPGALVPRLADAGLLARPEITTVLAAWRAPERLMASPPWRSTDAGLVDVLVFGETALLRRRRDATASRAPAGRRRAARRAARPARVTVVEHRPHRSRHARAARADGAATSPSRRAPSAPRAPHFRADADGFVDTGYACRLDRDTGTMTVTGPPPGLVTVGGYRFVLRDLEEAVRRADPDAGLAALPDALSGHRLAGRAADPRACARLLKPTAPTRCWSTPSVSGAAREAA